MSTNESVLESLEVKEGGLLDEIMAQTRIAPSEEGYDVAKKGVA
jgi:type VI secretion system protein ImpC